MTCTFQWYQHHRQVFIYLKSTIQLLMVQYWDVFCLFVCFVFCKNLWNFSKTETGPSAAFVLLSWRAAGKLKYHVHVFGWFMLFCRWSFTGTLPQDLRTALFAIPVLNYMYSGVVVPSSAWVEGSAGRWCLRLYTLVWNTSHNSRSAVPKINVRPAV